MSKDSITTRNHWLITVQILLLATLYFATGQTSFLLSASYHIVTPIIFAAEGFGLAAVILFGTRLWLGVFLGQLVLALYNGLELYGALGVSSINSIEAVIGAILFRRLALQPSFEKVRDVSGLWILVFLVLQPFSATFGNLVLWLDGIVPSSQLGLSWFSWWFGNSLGQVLITPLLLTFFSNKKTIRQNLQGILWLLLLLIPVGIIILIPISFSIITIAFTVAIPLLILIAVKSSMAMVNLATVVFTAIILFFIRQQLGEILSHGELILLVDLNIHLLAIILIGQFIAALLAEYKQLRLTEYKSSEHLQKIADYFPGMIYQFQLNPDGSSCFPYSSDGLQDICGVSPKEVQENADKLFTLIHPDDYNDVLASIADSAQNLTHWQMDYRIRFEDGVVRWLSGHSIPQREENGATLWYGFIKDITKLKQKDIEYKTIIEASLNGFCCSDFSGRFLSVNNALSKMLGYSEQELLNMSIMDIEAVENADDTAAHAQKVIQTGHDRFESQHRCKDGHIIDVEVNVLYVESLGLRFFAFVHDITDKKLALKALLTSEEKYRTLFDSIQDGIVFVDMQGTILDCNQCFTDMLGYSEEELKKITFYQITPEKWHALEAEMIEKEVIKRGYCDLFEKEYIRKDGTVFPIELRAWLAKDKNGNNQGMWAIVRDITERKLIAQTHEFLSQTVHQFTDESFFESLARYLAECLGMNFVCIDRLEGDGLTAQTVAVFNNGLFEDNISYALKDTPCGDVVGNALCCFPDSVCEFFPNDEVLKILKAESYMGVTLWSSAGQPIGLIAVIGEKPLTNKDLAESVLKIVAVRAAGELERKRIEFELLDTHEELKRYFDQPFIGMLTSGADKHTIRINQCLCDILGYSQQEMKSINWADITHPDDLPPSQAYLDQLISGHCDTFQMEKRYIHKDGRIVFVDLAVYCVRKTDGQVDYFIGMMLDITRRKLVEQYLQKNQALLQTAQRAARMGHYVADLRTTNEMTWTNDTLLDEIYGIDQQFPHTLSNWQRLIHPDDLVEVMRIFQALFADHPRFPDKNSMDSISYRIIRPNDGEVRWTETWAYNFYDDSGVIVQQVGMVQDITERKKTEQALIDKEALLSESQRIAHLGSWVLDTAGNISWSDEAFRIWGQKAGEFIPNAESFIPLIHPDDRAAMQTWNEQCFAGNKPSELEFRVVLPHEVRILIGRGELKQDANGQSYLAGTVQDVTERKLVERKVQESEERLNLSQEYGGIGSWEADMITGKQIWSRTVYQLLGFPALSNPTWEDFLSVVYPDDRQTVIDAGLAHLNHRAKYDVEYRATLTDGKIHWLRSAGQAQFAADDTAIKFMGIVQDITERKQTEIDLRIAATVFEAQEGMLITDANCIILKINHAFTLITGYSTTESIGQTPHFLQSGRHNKAFYDTLWQTIHDTGAWQGEIWDRRKNNEIYPQWLTITAVKDKNGAVVSHYVATLTDITARKANEETINRLAFYDPLTHLPNRRLLQERLKHGIEISHRTGSLMAVMMMDLDRFKAVNDSLGHAAGDALLQQVAERIKNRLREIDMVARLGGDEFVIVIDEVLRQDVDLIAKAIIQALSQPFTLYETHQVSIGVSIGIAFYPQHGDSADALMDNADTALYVAKDQGRGCFAYFSNSSKKPPSV